MGTYDTRGGAPLHDPAADYDGPCELCNKYADDCICSSMSLKEFTRQVNVYAREQCDAYNQRNFIFKAAHVNYSESMLKFYFENGDTPTSALLKIQAASISDNVGEGRDP